MRGEEDVKFYRSEIVAVHLFDESSQPDLLVELPSDGEVIPLDHLGQHAIDGMFLLHYRDEFLALLVVPEGRRLPCEHLLGWRLRSICAGNVDHAEH